VEQKERHKGISKNKGECMKSYRIYQIDAFTKTQLEGNPAGVVANADGLTRDQMQAIARELNNSETALIFEPSGSDHDVRIRFFTPTIEVPTCGHATISAHYVRAIEQGLQSCIVQQKIGIGILPVEVVKEVDDYRIIMTQGPFEISTPIDDNTKLDVLKALALSNQDLYESCPVQIASTGSSKVMIGIKSRRKLDSISPDLNSLVNISQKICCKGYFVFTMDTNENDILTHGRMFAPAMGIPEDPVTGNANGPLGGYLVHHKLLKTSNGAVRFNGKQGAAIGRPGIVAVTVEEKSGEPLKVKVSGHAVVAFKTAIII
jgi:PhzF family phenazine biosynthesis protein